uniref:Regulator of G-protein signalling 22 n=1 Tax=Cricetulus griseus TaxID=10029 RepID=A0A8C2MZ22_CRIGR
MPEKRLLADPPDITEEEFENYLATDGFLVDYFNEFLSLPTFSEAIRFNVDYGVFEVVNNAPQLLEKQLKRILQSQKPRNPIYDVIRKGKSDAKPFRKNVPREDETINITYTIMCLNREQGIKWIKRKRLPAFLESDCYFEYRLAKLISQATWSSSGMNFIVGTSIPPWALRKPPTPPPPSIEEENILIMKKFYVSLGQASCTQTKDWFTLAKQSERTVMSFSLPCCVSHHKISQPGLSSISESLIYEDGVHPRTIRRTSKMGPESEEEEEGSISIKDSPSQALLRIYLEKRVIQEKTLHFANVDEFLNAYIIFILREAMKKISDHSLSSTSDYTNFYNISRVVFDKTEPAPSKKAVSSPPNETADQVSEEKLEKVSLSSKSESTASESRADWCISHRTYDIGNRKEFERFKKFLKGTSGERYWWLWMDIERLKVLKDQGRHQRHLEKMKKCYLLSSGELYLSTEILSKFKLLHGSLWTEEHLKKIQIEVLKPLLLYWAPRFCVTHSSSTKNASAELKFWRLRQQKPREDVDPFPQMATLLPLRPKSCIPQVTEVQGDEVSLFQQAKSPNKLSRVSTGTQKMGKSEPLYRIPSKDDSLEKGLKLGNTVVRLTSFTDISECLKPQLERRYTYTEEPNVKATFGSRALGGFNMENLLQSLYVENRAGFFFTKFCENSGNKLWKNSVYFWFDLQAYHQLFYQDTLHPFKVCKQAQYLFATYIAPSATLDIGLDPEERKDIYLRIQPPFEDLFDTAEEYILLILLEPWTQMVMSDQVAYAQIQMKDIADELLLQRPDRKIGVWKPVESKWLSSSCEIIAFRKALLNPITARQFQRFVALKGDLLENGVLFWQEVQKFKDLCHSHCDESIIQQKITTIINCFINSCIPPALQIDIPIEQAQKIIEHRKELGPYVFREAQMTIFGVLFKFWPQFCEFRKNLTDEKIMSVLERRQEYKQKKKLSETDEDKIGKAGLKQYTSTTGSLTKVPITSESFLGLHAYGRQPTWCYSKYIEALEQERILLKIQEEVERKMFTGASSFTNLLKLPTVSIMSLKNLSLHSIQR